MTVKAGPQSTQLQLRNTTRGTALYPASTETQPAGPYSTQLQLRNTTLRDHTLPSFN